MAPALAGALEGLHLISAAALRVRKGALACSMLLFSRHRGAFSNDEFTALARRMAILLVLGWRQLPDLGAFTAEERRSRCAALTNGGLEMYYQPIIDLKSGRLAKVESLVRLHDGHRLLSSHQFLPLLDDDWLFMVYRQGLRQALADVRAWAEQGQAINLSINIPAQGIKQARYREATAEALRCFPLPDGRWLFLEILETERLDLSDPRALLSELERWQELGVRFAQDDLGSGYSSLLRLSRLPFEVVKIDQQLVRSHATAMDRKAVSKVLAFIAAITHLAHVLGLKVCVEGLENGALIDGARAIGADFGQGHAIAVPMPAGEVVGWAASRRPAPGAAPLNEESQLDAIYRELFEAASLDGINSDAHAQAYRRFYGLHADMVRQRLPAPGDSAIDPS